MTNEASPHYENELADAFTTTKYVNHKLIIFVRDRLVYKQRISARRPIYSFVAPSSDRYMSLQLFYQKSNDHSATILLFVKRPLCTFDWKLSL